MTAINAAVSDVPCVRIPLQTAYVSPTSPETTIFMYSTNGTDNQGRVELHLPDATTDVDEKTTTLASVFAKFEQDQGSYTISYQDDSNTVLNQNNIDILLGAAGLQSNDNNNFDIFENEIKHESELNSSPNTLVNRAERVDNDTNGNTTSTSQSTKTDDSAPSTEDGKGYAETKSPPSGKKFKPKASSPNGWGPQQCSICSKVFGNTSALAKHKLTHSDERKYGCVTCGKAFKRQDHLNGHMLTHRHKKPFECKADGCGKSYCDARSLRRHTENHHVHPSLPIATPTISVQEVISNTSNIPSCIQYAPKGTQSFQKINVNSTVAVAKLPKTNAAAAAAVDKSSSSLSSSSTTAATTASLKTVASAVNQTAQSNSVESNGDPTTSTNSNTAANNVAKSSSKDGKNGGDTVKPESKPVECNLCHRKFKNVPALNGHMRLHGGYFKKENEAKKWEKKESNGPHLTTASISVRALIEEKIIQKRSTALNAAAAAAAAATVSRLGSPNQSLLKAKLKSNEILASKLKTNVISIKEEPLDIALVKDYQPKVSSFAIPAAPSQQQQQQQQPILPSINADVLKRVNASGEERFGSASLQEETLIFNELLLKRDPQKQVKRASSDPGTMSHSMQSPQLDVTFSPENAYLDVYQNQNGQFFANNLTDDMFQQVQDANTMLLDNVDGTNELNNLSQIQNSDFHELSLEEYQNDLQHHQDLQAVLNSPLPVGLAEFSYTMQNETVISNHETGAVSYAQSPLPSPSFTYPTPPASQEGQSPSFCHVSSGVVHHAQVSSPLSSAFYSSGMSSPGAVEAALSEVLPMDVNQNVYPSPPSPSPLSVTPEPSPVSLATPTTAAAFNAPNDHLYQHDADDHTLLAAAETYTMYDTTADEYRNVILDCNRLIETDSQYGGCTEANVAAAIALESEGGGGGGDIANGENITLYADDAMSEERCNGMGGTFDERRPASSSSGGNGYEAAACDMAELRATTNGDISFGHRQQDANDAGIFYDKDIAFHMHDRDITLYAADHHRAGDIMLHSESQGQVVLHSDDKGNVIIQREVSAGGNATSLSFSRAAATAAEEKGNSYERRITFNALNVHRHCENNNITLHIENGGGGAGTATLANAHYDHKLLLATASKDYEETFVIRTSPSLTSSVYNSRKRHLNDDQTHKFPQRSRLRVHRHSSHMLHYTPCPMMNPLRNSSGLYWQATSSSVNSTSHKDEFGREVPKNELLIESDEDAHINVGPHFQAVVEPYRNHSGGGASSQSTKMTTTTTSSFISRDDLVWEPAAKYGLVDSEVDMYLEFACCAALPGGGRNKEYALHILHLCQGNINEAVLNLMQPKLQVPAEHPLLTYNYPDNDYWNAREVDIFQRSILKFDKNFSRIAQQIGTKTTKQCVQFYYLWKKACPEEYKRIRLSWRRIRETNFEKNNVVPISNINMTSETETISTTTTDTRPFACEFPDCLARFNSRAALNGHNRIHGGSVDRWRMITPSPLNGNANGCNSDTTEEFPCKLCGKVFSKIKSRSAHMKSHRPLEMESKKSKLESHQQKLELAELQQQQNNQLITTSLLLKKSSV